jgi:hypothetical protein
VIDLSLPSDEENFIADTSRDAEFTRKLFDYLSCDILGPPGDSKVIILDDSDEEKEAPDEMRRRPTPNSWLLMLLWWRKTIIVIIRGPIRRPVATMTMEVVTVSLRPPRRRPRC